MTILKSKYNNAVITKPSQMLFDYSGGSSELPTIGTTKVIIGTQRWDYTINAQNQSEEYALKNYTQKDLNAE